VGKQLNSDDGGRELQAKRAHGVGKKISRGTGVVQDVDGGEVEAVKGGDKRRFKTSWGVFKTSGWTGWIWRMANGEWRMANGEWRMANGRMGESAQEGADGAGRVGGVDKAERLNNSRFGERPGLTQATNVIKLGSLRGAERRSNPLCAEGDCFAALAMTCLFS